MGFVDEITWYKINTTRIVIIVVGDTRTWRLKLCIYMDDCVCGFCKYLRMS